uniref:Uncharacterized protein n=1 Tax=Spongospora subterranea TaxID=70186 RepID=A0A0H5QUZ9_9EUKA|eukprot:CRZ05396.1 hypothetical protein [Spongospora subterranea]
MLCTSNFSTIQAYITVKKTIVLAMSAYKKLHQQKRSRSNQIRRGCLGIYMSVSNQCGVRQKWKSMEMCLHFPSNSSGLGIRSTAPPKFTMLRASNYQSKGGQEIHINNSQLEDILFLKATV